MKYLIACMLLLPGMVCAAENAEPHWWEVATGILAIPVALIGLAYSYVLIKKTRLEAKKTELEIREKQSQLQKFNELQPEVIERLVAPIADSRVTQFLILRFILLYLILHTWSLLERGFGLVLKGLAFGIFAIIGESTDPEPAWLIAPYLILNNLPEVGYWIVFFAIGWPLFRDINDVVGLNMRELFSWRKDGKKDAEVHKDTVA